jgi:hypothetical protein
MPGGDLLGIKGKTNQKEGGILKNLMPTAVSPMFSFGHYVFLGFLCFLEKKTVVEGNSSLSLPTL